MNDKIPCTCGHSRSEHWFASTNLISCHYGKGRSDQYCLCYDFIPDNLLYLEMKSAEKEYE